MTKDLAEKVEGQGRWRWLVVVVVAATLVPVFIWRDQSTVERGNRLYRGGDALRAVEVYLGVGGDGDRGSAQYNLGTALLPLDPDSAEGLLRSATEASDPGARQRGFYNLGYRYLNAVRGPTGIDSSTTTLSAAVESNRAALRLNPADDAARWNLALAQRRLDELLPPDEEADRESGSTDSEELVIEDQALARSETADAVSGLEPEDPRTGDNTGERRGAEEGAREAWASQDPGPMTRDAAVGLLRRVQDQPETLIRGILWSHRPDIAWWESEPYPGGGW